MATLLKCFFSPQLYRIHKHGSVPGQDYAPNTLETVGDGVVKWIKFCWSFSCWTSPVILYFLYRRGSFSMAGVASLTSYATGVGIILVAAIWIRAIGRYMNPLYVPFVKDLELAQNSLTAEHKAVLSHYDFNFASWPVEFSLNPNSSSGSKKVRLEDLYQVKPRGLADKIKGLPCHILGYLAVHSFGRRMIYPGTTALIQALVGPMLTQGRTKLVEEKNGIRSKLQASDGNEIDTMFVDRRNNSQFPNGNTLVICSEGNSGFYELGAMVTPLEAGYSVFGWNHPGFWGSTGVPFPENEENAMDVVMQYATFKLGFPPENIALFAWSIGGYTATWAAMNYPDIHHVILDATFDDLSPIATARMPQSLKSLVLLTIKNYMNLNNADQLCKYPGPVLLIRRLKDEMISTDEFLSLKSNRGNHLLVKLLQYRYPRLFDDDTRRVLDDWLGQEKTGQVRLLSKHEVDDEWCESLLRSVYEEHGPSFPMPIGEDLEKETRIQLIIFLASKYMEDFDATHCQPLPGNYMKEPWTLE